VLNRGFRDHVTPALQQLHWLPVEYRIKYKLCAFMHTVLGLTLCNQSLNLAVDPV